MSKRLFGRRLAVATLAAAMWILPVAAIAQQTQITAPKNKYKVQDDIQLGQKASNDVERQFPLINDADAQEYLTGIGNRLVRAIPPEFQHPEFNYRFQWVNASDLNAFALPGGPMFVDRGMLEKAKNEGELAGVMAHELSHVALRHATAQATKNNSAGNTARSLLLILGGAAVGGQAGAELGAVAAQSFMLKYSREYESQADALGAIIMARAGYDPHDLANVFRTIESQGGNGGPQFLSDHPDPGNRYDAINREANDLQISPNPIKMTAGFERIQAKFRAMPRARSMAEIEKANPNGQGSTYPTSNGRYSNDVQYPATNVRAYSKLTWLRINVPSNWVDLPGQDDVSFAPAGAYGEQGITRGVMIGTYSGKNRDLARDSQDYMNDVLQGNNYLRQRGSSSRTYVAGRQGMSASLSGRSPVTGRTEIVTIYTTQLNNGELFYAVTVVPDDESSAYSDAFRNMLSSIRLND